MPQDNKVVLNQAFKEFFHKQNDVRIKKQEKAYDYFVGNEDAILGYLTTAMEISFDSEDVEDMQLQFVNITERLITQLATIYNEPSDIVLQKDKKPDQEATEYYNDIQSDKNNTAKRTTLYYAKLLNKALLFVEFDEENQKIVYKARPSHLYTVVPDKEDPKKIDKVLIPVDITDDNRQVETMTAVWSKEKNFRVDALGNERAIGNNTKKVNPYGILPFAELEIYDLHHYWGEIQSDIINVNEQINVLLTLLVNEGAIMGMSGTPVATNLDLHKKGKVEKGDSTIKKVRRGPKHVIVRDNVHKDEIPPSLVYTSSNPLITEVIEMVDRQIKLIAATKGADPNTFLDGVKATSGFSKVMDSLVQLETRIIDVDPCRVFEKQLYKITVAVNNYFATTPEGAGLTKIDESLTPLIDFVEPEIPKTVKDINEEREFNKKHNLESPLDWKMQDNPDIETEEQALKIIRKNKKINAALSSSEVGTLSLAELVATNKLNGEADSLADADLLENENLLTDEGDTEDGERE